ncbi:glycoside hydrolase family 43 protein [Streptomyces sp. UH6]|uniref:glycoside hydrolase family 43 protein n=1 Tax=Streptomyces sp. UH6 TaxID=2748379 RepID=UPI0015D4CEF6|nr:glycoside hydrolase family 43 protein [Streptomyces sp. UH6]NYV77978.1 family 43 glycosylhydrolase [Streptomyces sp. UH6]
MRLPERPVVPGFHPDPSVCRVGSSYYLVCSSFEYAPGVPVFRSPDLRTWRQIGNVLDRPSQLAVNGAGPSGGVFAPTLRHHDGRFWMITTNHTHRAGLLLVTAEDPAGPWSDPVWIDAPPGVDPDLAWDRDGTCLVTWSGADATGRSVVVQAALDPLAGKLLEEPRQLWSGTGGKYPEAPHLYRIGEHWYLLIAEGGTERGHAVTIARGPSPAGPFDPCPDNPLLTARGLATAVQNTGHADLVQRPDGTWATVFLGVRALGGTPHWHVLGRETYACEVVLDDDGWPRLGDPIEPDAPAALTEELTGPALPLSWVGAERFPAEVLRPMQGGGWRLTSAAGADPVFVGRRQQHLTVRARAALDVSGGTGGLELRVDARHAVTLEAGHGAVRAVATIGEVRAVLGEREAGPDVTLELRTGPPSGPALSHGPGPDEIVAGVVDGAGFHALGRLDGRYLSTETAGGFTGRMIGLTCSRGRLAVASFSYRGSDEPALPDSTAV